MNSSGDILNMLEGAPLSPTRGGSTCSPPGSFNYNNRRSGRVTGDMISKLSSLPPPEPIQEEDPEFIMDYLVDQIDEH